MNSTANEPVVQYLPDQIVLLGDSIFDNAPYVDAGESVAEQLQKLVHNETDRTSRGITSTTTQVELLAVDGHVMANIPSQIKRVQSDRYFTNQYAFLSCGGNDVLGYSCSGLLNISANNLGDALNDLHQVREQFRQSYQEMITVALRKFPKLTVCTIYDSVPTLSNAEKMALALFNEVILREASERQLAMLDLRVICNQVEDYAPISPIEPSKYGAAKIAQAIFNQYKNRNREFGV
ncbi:SGNH/GDSL hydrolase family protein [Vibrio parahaemolyticus]|uniref:SGNH/GDSL hydrolase family protein n=1 Tax=Vibrio parahaemolyticus TaxID=670 RepID=UPI002360687F|nr:SGNH/GDSL hydrolase family protein [Vibrio parahaemolyticus]